MAAGNGPKQYRLLGGKPVLRHCVDFFDRHPAVTHIQVVIHPDDADTYAQISPDKGKFLPPRTGGSTRQESVRAGLEAISHLKPHVVLIHDAARPFLDAEIVDELIAGAESGIGTIPAYAVADTLKKSDGKVVTNTVERSGLWGAQTPQCFVFDDIAAAHRKFAGHPETFTDDAALAQAAGITVRLVESPASNFKVTTEDDMRLARIMVSQHPADIRTGNGYDVHRIAPGKGVVLCGIQIPGDFSLVGHSDADVGLHALTDALLATIGSGDIGSHFPPSDPQWKDVSSDRFLAHAAKLVREAGGVINHLDVTLVCEQPKIGPHRDAMRQAIAAISEIAPERVSVKATTNETIGFVGRREGIAAIATATVNLSPAGVRP